MVEVEIFCVPVVEIESDQNVEIFISPTFFKVGHIRL